MNDYAFGNFLCELRREKGFSQAQLGEMLGVTNKAVSKWENGSAKPNTSLLPRIAEILGVTVEELFACKRLEASSERERIQRYLAMQKRRYATASSVLLSVLLSLPLLLVEFICVVMGFHLSDEVAGPLGAMAFLLSFVASLTAFFIYRKQFKRALTPSVAVYSPRFVRWIRRGMGISATVWWCLLVLAPTVYLLIVSFSSRVLAANVFLAVVVLAFIVTSGVLLCLVDLKRRLRLRFSEQTSTDRGRLRFSDLPAWGKVCFVAVIVLLPILLNLYFLGFLGVDRWGLRYGCTLIFLGCELALIVYQIKRNH